MHKSFRSLFSSGIRNALFALAMTLTGGVQAATTTLSDNPLYSASTVPANLMLALSVEFPTATVAAYKGASDYSSSVAYLGYFDNTKCYDYSASGYFVPLNPTTNPGPVCSGNHWSGNMLNWATMAGLDEFRQALTGGNRSIDGPDTTVTPAIPAITVLVRSNLTTQGSYRTNFPDKQIGGGVNVSPSTVIGDSVLQSAANVYIRSGGLGTTFQVSNNSSFSGPAACVVGNLVNCTNTYNAQVQVCLKSVGLETNCNSYSGNTYPGSGTYDKPEGLIQQNYQKIRVGASAYAFINGNSGPNGAVRALLRDNGPTLYVPNGNRNDPSNVNPYTEWSPTTGVFPRNPDFDHTTNTAPGGKTNATDSGAINYLNKFGSGANYETYDTVADLYWATLAYFMQVKLDDSYTKNLSLTNSLDPTFPVFTGTPPVDPISYSCQANAIVTIGDDHTHYDTAVPSSGTLSSVSGGALTPIAANGTVPQVDAYTWTNQLGNLPLIEGASPASGTYSSNYSASNPLLGGVTWQDNATYYLAGLAYFAHVNDLRNDQNLTPATPASLATLGKQTITTYAVDVLEPGTYDGSSTNNAIYNPKKLGSAGPSIYWLAAKYGGFNNPSGSQTPTSFLDWHTNTTKAADYTLRPDNYFFANQPNLLQAGLAQIFNKVSLSATQSGSAPTVTPTRVLTSITANTLPYRSPVSGFPIYNTNYTPNSWDGDLSSFVAAAVEGGGVTPIAGSNTPDAQAQLELLTQTANGATFGWDTGRRVITYNGTTGVPFRYGSLSASEKLALNSDASLVSFLRGDKSNELTKFRGRTHILGDIVDSQAALVQGASSPAYTETSNPGYTAFSTLVANRQPVVYVGANDGMLHAFQADFPTTVPPASLAAGGNELFAYVPSLLFNGPNGTPQTDGLAALANLAGSNGGTGAYNVAFAHHFYVDQTPQISDVDFNLTGLNPTPSTSLPSGSNWRTMLVGGLGKGGKGIYALDVTTVPSTIDTSSSSNATTGEGALASNVLWEFTAPDMGYSYGRPLIVKTRKYGWVVIMTSGYDNNGSGQDGHGVLYILNAKTGALIQQIDTNPTSVASLGSVASPAGLAQATAFTQDVSDGTIEQVYAGDLLGHLWRFDLSERALDATGTATGNYPPATLFATLTNASGNAQPITTAPRIELSLDSSGTGTLRYVFVGTGQYLDPSDLNTTQRQTMYFLRDGTGATPSAASAPLVRASLTADTDLTLPLTGLSDTSAGYYYDLLGSGAGIGAERIVVNPDAAAGVTVVTWATVTPSTNPCSLSGAIYAIDYTTGQSVILDSSNAPTTSHTTTTAPTGVQVVQLPNGLYSILYGTTGALPQTAKIQQPSGTPFLKQTNWREILD